MEIFNSIGIEHITLVIIILTLVLFLTDKYPVSLIALVSSIALALVGAMDFSQIYNGFTSTVAMLVFGMMIVGAALSETGVVTVVAKRILKTKLANNERTLIVLLMVLVGISSAFLSNTAVVATFIPLIGAMVATSNGRLTNKNLLMPVGIAASVGGAITLVGSTSQLMVNSVLEEYEYQTLGMFDFAWIAIPLLIISIIYMSTIGYNLQKRHFDFEDITEDIDTTSFDNFKPTSKTYIATATIIFCIIGFTTGFLPIEVVALIGAAIVLMTRCIDFDKCMKQIDWNTFLLIAFAQGIAAGMNDSGAGELVADLSVNVLGENVWVLFVLCIVLTLILTKIMSNSAVAAMITPIFIGISVGIGYHPFVFAIGIAIASNIAIGTPIATTTMSQVLVGGYRFKDYLKIGMPLSIILTIVLIILTPMVFDFTEL